MLASLEAAYTAQRRFVADASHELRAPLTTIRGNLEFVRRARDLPAQTRDEALVDALAESERMTRLVDDLLALARADAGQALDMRPVALHELLADLRQEVAARAGERELCLERLDEAWVWGDPDRLKQVALILVDNALRYTPAGGTVTLSLVAGDGRATLRVADTGIGIDPEDRPHIFDRFYRADKARARDEAGAGLGLAIAAAIVDQHEGSIEVESAPGAGSIFAVHLRLYPNN
jgi:two-component system, OmpR family, sensor kinase